MRTRLRPFALLAGLLLLVSAAPLLAQSPGSDSYDPKIFSALQWRLVGPNRGGRSLCATGSAQRPLEYYFGAVGGGLWKTTDGGTTWRPVTDGQIKSSSVGSCAVAPSNPDVVWIGMGETQFRGNIMQGDGLYKSVDAGKTWTHMGLSQIQAFARVRIHPKNPDIVFAAAFGKPYAESEDRGIFKTTDGGKTWRKVLYRSPKASGVDVSIDPSNPNVVFAALWEAWRTPWSMNSGGADSAFYKSTDGGETWTEITRAPGLPSGVIGKIGVAVSPVDSNRVFAIIENENGGLFRSDDGGATWKKVNDDRALRQRAFYYTRVVADPQDKNVVYVLNVNFHKSTDGGEKFQTISVPHGDNHDLWIAPNDNKRMVESNDGGGTVTFNGGETWTDLDFPTAQLYHVITTRDFNYHVCGAQQDNTTVCVPSQSDPMAMPRFDPGAPGAWYYQVGGGESGYIAPDPRNPDVFFAGSQGALLTRFNRRTGHLRDVQMFPDFFSGMPSSDLKERSQWTYPIVFHPLDPGILFATTQHVWMTRNEGRSWERISPDLTRADPKTLGPTGGPITKDMNGPEIYATVFALAPSRVDKNTIWAGSDDGYVHVTRDFGKTWTNVTPPGTLAEGGMGDFSRISIIDASAHDAGTAYVCAKRYQLDDRDPYIWKTNDYGKTWTKIVNGIAKGHYVHVVREDPRRRGLLYAGTEHGVYVSFDDGRRFQPLNQNLPDVQISDLVVEDNDLVIATHGRSMWVMDGIAALRQITPEKATAALAVLEPRTAIRGVPGRGAVVEYLLRSEAARVTVEILDPSGTVIRTIVGDADAEKRPTASADFSGPAGTRPPTRRAGLNRFTWDLRYPGAERFDGMILWSARPDLGPIAVPGVYKARVTAEGVTQTVDLKVDMDPRLEGVTIADLKNQFDLAMKINDATSAAHGTVKRIREIRTHLLDVEAKAKDRRISADTTAVLAKLTAIEEELYQTKNRSGQDPLNFPIRLGNKLAALRRSLETGDGPPSPGASEVFGTQKAQLDSIVARYESVLKVDLAALNRRLAAKKLAEVKVALPAKVPQG